MPVGGVCEGGYKFGEGLSSQRVPEGGPSRVSPPTSQVSGEDEAARVSGVCPPFPRPDPSGTVPPWPLFFLGAVVTVPAPGCCRDRLALGPGGRQGSPKPALSLSFFSEEKMKLPPLLLVIPPSGRGNLSTSIFAEEFKKFPAAT